MINKIIKPNNVFGQFILFGLIGGMGMLVNMGLYTLFILTVLKGGPFIANVIATVITIFFNWFGNRVLTFKGGQKTHTEVIRFFIVSIFSLPINAVSLYFMREVLGLTSILTDNVSIIIGTAVGMILKFLFYKFWVFTEIKK